MSNKQNDLDVVGAFAADLKRQLGTIDSNFTDRSSGEKNKALRLDPRKLFEELTHRRPPPTDLAHRIVNEKTISETGQFIPPPAVSITEPPANTNEKIYIGDKQFAPTAQLELELGVTPTQVKVYNNLNDLADLFVTECLKIHTELRILKALIKEIKLNTTKRKYKQAS